MTPNPVLRDLRAEARLRKVLADEDPDWTRTVHSDGDDIVSWHYLDGRQVRINVNPQPLDEGGLSFDVVTHNPDECVTEPWAVQAPLPKAERRARAARRSIDQASFVGDDVIRARRDLHDLVREGHIKADMGPAWRMEAPGEGDTLLVWRHTRGVVVRIEMQEHLTPAGGVACNVEFLERGGAGFDVSVDGRGIHEALELARSLCSDAERAEQAIITVPATGASLDLVPGGVEVSITYPGAEAVAAAAREHLAAIVEHRHSPDVIALAAALPGHLVELLHAACQLRRGQAEPWGRDPERVWQFQQQAFPEHLGWWVGYWNGPYATEDEARAAAPASQADSGESDASKPECQRRQFRLLLEDQPAATTAPPGHCTAYPDLPVLNAAEHGFADCGHLHCHEDPDGEDGDELCSAPVAPGVVDDADEEE